ncbi:hypothetical protein CRENBAI_009968 [Crenichthys baileyi]|uniref:Uncharacterized protein n=1 Tax=Crenichthys baileyi TaxID=28760 RepID=A0AAV9S168_9TELE
MLLPTNQQKVTAGSHLLDVNGPERPQIQSREILEPDQNAVNTCSLRPHHWTLPLFLQITLIFLCCLLLFSPLPPSFLPPLSPGFSRHREEEERKAEDKTDSRRPAAYSAIVNGSLTSKTPKI